MDFAIIRENATTLSPALLAAVFVLGLIGFGTKAGIIPLHIWLPEAHPAAPSHISALLSGVMIKTAIYAFVRLTFDLMPPLPIGWGLLVLVLASISAVVGVLYALAEHDLKRLLAYHSVENIGIILMGVGAALVFRTLEMPIPAAIALAAGFFHVLNHAVFKSLLFFGAGAVANETGTRNVEEYGGLLTRMPWTGATFLVGAVAISGLPPFNGFASEWLTYQSIIGSLAAMPSAARIVAILTIASLALTGGLAAACFVKAFGITFLARPRSEHAEHAKEVAVEMRISMATLAVLCLALGVASPLIVRTLATVATSLGLPSAGAITTAASGIVLGGSTLALPLVTLALVFLGGLLFLIVRLVLGRQREVVYTTWDCGNDLGPRMEYTGTAFARSLLVVFKGILRPTKQLEMEYHDADVRYLTKSLRADSGIISFAHRLLYDPLDRAVTWLSRQVARLQSGSIHAYLLYILLVLVGLIAFAL
jgi:hydrogenase-4 component B